MKRASERTVLWAGLIVTAVSVPLLAAPSETDPAATAPAAVAPAAVASAGTATDPQYIIGPGDELQVFVWRNTDLSVTVPVKPDGRITTPLVEDMQAAGKTAGQLARDIETVLAQYVRTPQVNVIVTVPRSLYSAVKLVGQVKNPQSVAFHEGLTVLDAVLLGGGLTDFAAGNRARIIRKENGRTVEVKVRIKDMVERGDLRTNVPLRPGDTLIVPESRF
ncbi:MAG: polysaccharide export protein [Gammaproteobacteria bacterium]|nr:polysaccharide export protein [Gammaproteobacteria bacterium]